jgi:DNA-binding beta-propeller fold protein YncE
LGPFVTTALTVLAGCGGGSSQPGLSSATPFTLTARAASVAAAPAVTRAERPYSWMSPDAKNADLLYVSNDGNNLVYVYSYPQGRLKGFLTGFNEPQGECADKAGDVWITNTNDSDILEYAHGGTSPIETLNDPGEYPVGCAIDPTTGNLAVTNISGTSSYSQGNILVYPFASGTPTSYTDPAIYNMYFCGYDDKGNLFVDGLDLDYRQFQFAELPKKGKNLFKNISLNRTIAFPGEVQWDGKYVAVGDQGEGQYGVSSAIDRTTGASGKVVAVVPLSGSCDIVQGWIQSGQLVGPEYCSNEAGVWKYPAGGTATKTLAGEAGPIGSVVSLHQ